jgi:methylphosphotriester-DNA--protein-cysteine methyltransferase
MYHSIYILYLDEQIIIRIRIRRLELKGREFNMPADINLSFEEMWEKIIACDPKYDGVFFTAVKTTKIYCRPSYKSRKPKKINAEFYFDINEVEKAGFRACKRCQPEVVHSPHAGLIRKVIAFLVTHYKKTDITEYCRPCRCKLLLP